MGELLERLARVAGNPLTWKLALAAAAGAVLERLAVRGWVLLRNAWLQATRTGRARLQQELTAETARLALMLEQLQVRDPEIDAAVRRIERLQLSRRRRALAPTFKPQGPEWTALVALARLSLHRQAAERGGYGPCRECNLPDELTGPGKARWWVEADLCSACVPADVCSEELAP